MKLVTVLMLVALPLYCYAGSGCAVLEEVVEETIDPSLSTTEYLAAIREYVSDDATAKAAVELKQCFLNQSNETLNNIRVMQGDAGSKFVTNYARAMVNIPYFISVNLIVAIDIPEFLVCSVLTFHKIFGSEDYREWSEINCRLL
ncbi:mammaglobin-A-like [Diceros bicornis minor]|uniref:mammaglobin-A-like n=1 Tax=Diceros bicornis minor TaxID=77932 RepID=UPI0026EA9669|nr:mammaglobin-A-like [Diceros bicornis minor]